MTRALTELANLVGQFLPTWAVWPALGAVAVLLVPVWLQSVRSRQIGGRTRRMVRADDATRRQLIDEVMGLTGNRPRFLVIAVEQALRYDQRELRERALVALEATGKAGEDVKRLRAKVRPEPIRVGHPVQEAVAIARMLDEGLVDTARDRLAAARKRYPDDAELAALDDRARAAPGHDSSSA